MKSPIDRIIERASAELVEELLEESEFNGGRPWFVIIRDKMKLVERRKQKLTKDRGGNKR